MITGTGFADGAVTVLFDDVPATVLEVTADDAVRDGRSAYLGSPGRAARRRDGARGRDTAKSKLLEQRSPSICPTHGGPARTTRRSSSR